LRRAASNLVATADVLPLIAFAAVNYIPVLLILTVYMTVLVALSRSYRDSEMVIWFASGQSLTAWINPVFRFAAPFLGLIAVVGLFVGPWASQQADIYQRRFEQREDVSRVAPGQFRESAGSNRVFFVESISPDQMQVRNVFVTQFIDGRLTVVASTGGRVEVQGDSQRFLILEDGHRWDGLWGGNEYRLMEFERYGLRLDGGGTAKADASNRLMSTMALIADPTPSHLGELIWRVGLPLSGVTLTLLAIPLAFVNPRVGQSVNIILAVLIYVIYSNVTGLMQVWVAQGRISFALALFVTHAAVLAIAGFLFWRRMTLVRLWPAWLPSLSSLRSARASSGKPPAPAAGSAP
jgi:lipopolysaccharide export system permease protein